MRNEIDTCSVDVAVVQRGAGHHVHLVEAAGLEQGCGVVQQEGPVHAGAHSQRQVVPFLQPFIRVD